LQPCDASLCGAYIRLVTQDCCYRYTTCETKFLIMTKQEKIKEEWVKIYGEDKYDKIKYAIKDNGYIDCIRNPEISKIISTVKREIYWGTTDYMPKSLKGIHINNGWKLIEDLDIEDDEYVLFLRYYEGEGEPPIFTCLLGEDFQIGYFTHWKRIDFEKPPLFDAK
jgi:hypothetical protein